MKFTSNLFISVGALFFIAAVAMIVKYGGSLILFSETRLQGLIAIRSADFRLERTDAIYFSHKKELIGIGEWKGEKVVLIGSGLTKDCFLKKEEITDSQRRDSRAGDAKSYRVIENPRCYFAGNLVIGAVFLLLSIFAMYCGWEARCKIAPKEENLANSPKESTRGEA